MYKSIVCGLLLSSSVFAKTDIVYTVENYFRVLGNIKEMNGLYCDAPDGGIAYIMSEASSKDYCWLKTIDSNGVSNVRKFYVDWTNGKYTPETYGRSWNEMCKVSKRKKKFVDTDRLVIEKFGKVYRFFEYKLQSDVKYGTEPGNDFNFEWYYDDDRYVYGNYSNIIFFKIRKLGFYRDDSLKVEFFNIGYSSDSFVEKFLFIKRDEVCKNDYYFLGEYYYERAGRFLKFLKKYKVVDFNCKEE